MADGEADLYRAYCEALGELNRERIHNDPVLRGAMGECAREGIPVLEFMSEVIRRMSLRHELDRREFVRIASRAVDRVVIIQNPAPQ